MARDPVRIWLEDWRLRRGDDGVWHLQAAAGDIALDLDLAPRKRPVLQGDAGLSQKSDAPGNASYYYSLTRLEADGTVTLDGRSFDTRGRAWLDREWSTSALGPEQAGWDWFALQLDDGRDIMLYRLRRKDGATSRWSAGVIVAPDGAITRLEADDFRLEVLDRWASPRGGSYPSRWRLHLDPLDQPLTVAPVLADQELAATVRYWEGAVDVLADGEPIGRGYMELTGYADETE